jgi:hypothetical protein
VAYSFRYKFAFKAPEKYYESWKRSIEDPEGFWNEHVRKTYAPLVINEEGHEKTLDRGSHIQAQAYLSN